MNEDTRRPVAVFGVGGHGRSVGEILKEYGHNVSYLDDQPNGVKVLGGSERLKDEAFLRDYLIAIGIGDNKLRHHFSLVVLKSGGYLKTVRHPKSVIAPSALIGQGCQFFPGSIVWSHAKIENFVIVNNNVTVPHDCILRDGVQVADGGTLGGGVVVGQRTLIGLHAVVLPKVKIGRDCIVGAGAVVTKDVPDGSVVKGNPAR